jgi:hypothetical protein
MDILAPVANADASTKPFQMFQSAILMRIGLDS